MAKMGEYLSLLEDYLSDLAKVAPATLSFQEFSSNPSTYYAALHLTQLTIQPLIDLSYRLISLMNWKRPKEYTYAARILLSHGALSEADAKNFESMIRFRNLLVHTYARVNQRIVYDLVTKRVQADARRISQGVLEAAIREGIDP